MSNNARGKALLIGGALLALIALSADAIGLGGFPGIGYKQILGIVVGVAIAVTGFLSLNRRS